eukprot:5437875-Amphidinium_carterae.2
MHCITQARRYSCKTLHNSGNEICMQGEVSFTLHMRSEEPPILAVGIVMDFQCLAGTAMDTCISQCQSACDRRRGCWSLAADMVLKQTQI